MKKIKAIAVSLLMVTCLGACSQPEKGGNSSESDQIYSSEKSEAEDENAQENKVKNPLTGEYGFNANAVGKRPVAVMVSNIKASLPQYGIDDADIIYELPVEGGITRLMAVYADYTEIPDICSVRSCRYYYPILAYGMDAIYCHWGTDRTIALDTLNDLGIDRFDGNDSSLGYGTVFVRDENRAQSYATEHTGCLKGSELERAIADMGYRTDINEENAGGAFVFNSPDAPEAPEGTVCMSAELEFSSDYYSTFEFDSESGTYLKYHSGSPHKDGVTGNQLEFTNVFALETDISVRSDGKLMDIGLDGGSGYYISMGKAQQVSWSKESAGAPVKIYGQTGELISVNAGKSYIGFIEGADIDLQ